MKQLLYVLLMSMFVLTIHSSQAQDSENVCACYRPEYYAPIGVMISHSHGKGKWMLSYRNMNMYMKNNQEGSRSVSLDELYQKYPMVTSSMNMNMSMGMVMYGLSDRITLMAMGHWVVNTMHMSMDMSGGHVHSGSNDMAHASRVSGV